MAVLQTQNMYSRMLLLLAGSNILKFVAPQFAFRAQHQAHEPVFIMRNLVEKAIEWNVPIFVVDGAIHKAYDYTLHQEVIVGLQWKHVPNILIAGWLREIRRVSCTVILDPYIRSEPIRRTRSLYQGDPAAPYIFNCTLDGPASRFCEICHKRKWSIRLDDGTLVSLILFADNFWLFATSPSI